MKDIESYLKHKKNPRFLLIRLKPIGDTILMSPVLRNLRRRYPDATIDVVVFPFVEDVIRHNPHVDNVIVLGRSNWSKLGFYMRSMFKRYDIIIDFINNPTSAITSLLTHAYAIIGNKTRRSFFYDFQLENRDAEYSAIRNLKKLEPLGFTDFSDYLPEAHIRNADIGTADRFYHSLGPGKPFIGLFSSAKYPSKTWPAEHFASLGRMIAETNAFRVLYLFGRGEESTYNIVRTETDGVPNIFLHTPDTGLGELCALISRLTFMVTGDTGPKHIATALNVPTLTIFSASNEKVWNPPDLSRFPVVRKTLPCSPCNKNHCPLGTYACMRTLSPEEVYSALERAIPSITPETPPIVRESLSDTSPLETRNPLADA